MKKILLMSRCHFTRLAFKEIFEGKIEYSLDFISVDSLPLYNYKSEILLIHVNSDEYSTISLLLNHRHSVWFRDAIFITEKELIPFFDYMAKINVKFIDLRLGTKDIESGIINNPKHRISNEVREMLSVSEFRVIKMLLSGLTPTKIAFRTKKSVKTISSQKVNALRKLNLDNTPHSLVKLINLFY